VKERKRTHKGTPGNEVPPSRSGKRTNHINQGGKEGTHSTVQRESGKGKEETENRPKPSKFKSKGNPARPSRRGKSLKAERGEKTFNTRRNARKGEKKKKRSDQLKRDAARRRSKEGRQHVFSGTKKENREKRAIRHPFPRPRSFKKKKRKKQKLPGLGKEEQKD